MTLVDTNVLLDVATDDPKWARWSLLQLDAAAMRGPVVINAVVYAEFSIGYMSIEAVDRVLAGAGLELIGIPRAALFLAGKVFQRYRARGGSRTGVLPDFFIGAHAAVAQLPLLTRDPSPYRRYFSGMLSSRRTPNRSETTFPVQQTRLILLPSFYQLPLMSNVDTKEIADSQAAGPAPSVAAPQKATPISVFVSRKLSRLFVHQGFTALFDVAVKIQNSEERLGTHVFTVMEPQNEGSAMRWTVVSIPEQGTSADSTKERKTPKQQVLETAPSVQSSDDANSALDRIEIPQDAAQQISELLTPGSSLIISDYGISSETGPYTDFVVLTH